MPLFALGTRVSACEHPTGRRAAGGRTRAGSFTIRVAERGGRLWLESPPGPTSELVYRGDRPFAAALEPGATGVTFDAPDRSGRSTRLVLLMAGMPWYGRRIE